jgi:hypothetical protein
MMLPAGFVSLDCGGTADYTDELGLRWTSDAGLIPSGTPITVNNTSSSSTTSPSEKRTQYTTLRSFPADDKKYCYTLNVTTRTRYLLRATFLYSNFDHNSNVFPEFDLYLGATRWSTIVVYDDSRIVTREAIVLAPTDTVSMCLSNATTGQPFISTLELRQLNGSLYYTADEAGYFLSLAARINFGAPTTDPVRYFTTKM